MRRFCHQVVFFLVRLLRFFLIPGDLAKPEPARGSEYRRVCVINLCNKTLLVISYKIFIVDKIFVLNPEMPAD